MVGALTFITVWQKKDDARVLSPLLLARRYELVDDGLCAIGEVTELRFPQDKRVRVSDGVAVFVGHRGVLGKQRVVNPEACLVFGQVEKGQPFLTVDTVVENGVTLNERSAACILTGEANLGSFEQERAEGENLAEAPVDLAVAAHVDSLGKKLFQLGVDAEAGGRVSVRVTDAVNDGHIDTGRGGVALGLVRGRRLGVRDDRRVDRRCVCLGERVLEKREELGLNLVVLGLGDVTTADERLCVQGANRALGFNEVVHQRLGHRRVVALIVSAATVADEVDDDVVLEFLAVSNCELRHAHDGLGVIAIDVEDRCLNGLGNVGRVERRARVARQRRESDLVVGDDVDGSTGAVTAQLGHLQRLNHNALSRHRRVSVDEDGKNGEGRDRLEVLLGTNDSFEHAVDGFEVRRIRGEVDGNRLALGGDELPGRSQVVLDVTRTLDGRRVCGSFELAEDLTVGLARDVGEDVEAATVGHSHVDLVQPEVCCVLNDFVEKRDHRFATLEREALLADVLGLQEGLERFGLVESVEDAHLFVVRRLLVRLFELLLEPLALGRVLEVCVFNADSAAVGITHETENFTEQHRTATGEATDDELAVKVPERQSVVLDFEVGVSALLVLQRVGVGHAVTANAERVDEFLNTRSLVDRV